MVFWAGLRTRVCFPPTMVSHTLVGQEFLWVEWFAVWLPHAYFRSKPIFNKLNRGIAHAYWVTAFMPIVLSKIFFFDSPSSRLPMLHKNHRISFVECFKAATFFSGGTCTDCSEQFSVGVSSNKLCLPFFMQRAGASSVLTARPAFQTLPYLFYANLHAIRKICAEVSKLALALGQLASGL